MNPEEYLSKSRFPITNKNTLSLDSQKMLDSFNYDQLQEYLESGGKLDAEQKAILAELKTKLGK